MSKRWKSSIKSAKKGKVKKIVPKKAATKKGQRKGQKTSNRKCKTCKSSPISAIKSSFPNNSAKKAL